MKQALTFLTLLCSLTISRAADEPATNAAKDNDAARRPNLVFVFSDQQSWDMMGACGNLANNCTVDFSPETSYFRDDDGKKLYGDPQHKEIQEQLHAETRKWIAQYQDVGSPYRTILELNQPNREGSR